MASSNVRFIRKDGRIIPIKEYERQQRNQKREGAILIGAGAGVASASGRLAGRSIKAAKGERLKAQYFRVKLKNSFRQFKANELARPRLARQGAQFLHQANVKMAGAMLHEKTALHALSVGHVVGGTLIAAGVHKYLPEEIKRHRVADATITTGAGLVSSHLIKQAYAKGVSGKTLFAAAKKVLTRFR